MGTGGVESGLVANGWSLERTRGLVWFVENKVGKGDRRNQMKIEGERAVGIDGQPAVEVEDVAVEVPQPLREEVCWEVG